MTFILEHFKPDDYILIAIAVGLSFLPLIITSKTYFNKPNAELVAIVKINGKVVDELSLNSPVASLTDKYLENLFWKSLYLQISHQLDT